MPRTNDPATPAIAKRLREARLKIFASAAEAARALGMKDVTLRAHENGQNGVGYGDLERYARRYGVSPGWLITGKGEEDAQIGEWEGYGELMSVYGTVQDGVWLEDDESELFFPRRTPMNTSGLEQSVVYSDPRFPPELITAMRVVSPLPDSAYSGDCIVFAVPAFEIGFTEGDHVVIYLMKAGFTQVTLRKVVKGRAGNEFHALISHDPVLTQDNLPKDTEEAVVGVVVGIQSRRAVNQLTTEARRLAIQDAKDRLHDEK